MHGKPKRFRKVSPQNFTEVASSSTRTADELLKKSVGQKKSTASLEKRNRRPLYYYAVSQSRGSVSIASSARALFSSSSSHNLRLWSRHPHRPLSHQLRSAVPLVRRIRASSSPHRHSPSSRSLPSRPSSNRHRSSPHVVRVCKAVVCDTVTIVHLEIYYFGGTRQYWSM